MTGSRAEFDCSTPDGYPETDVHQADSNELPQKRNFAAPLGERLTALIATRLAAPATLAAPEGHRFRVEWKAIRLADCTFGPRSYEGTLELPEDPFANSAKAARDASAFIAQTPETQLR